MPRADRDPEATPAPRTIELRAEWIWPLAIVIALLIVMAVNAAYIWIAVTGADDVVPSYVTEER
jgi:hypothetical protein